MGENKTHHEIAKEVRKSSRISILHYTVDVEDIKTQNQIQIK